MQKPKVLIFIRKFPVISQTFIVNQIVDLKQRGFEVEILCDHKKPDEILHQAVLDNDLLEITTASEISMNPLIAFCRFIKYLVLLPFSSTKRKLRHLKTLNFLRFGKEGASLEVFFRSLLLPKYDNEEGIIIAHFGFEGKLVTDLKECGFLGGYKMITVFHGFDIIPTDYRRIRYYERLFKTTNLLIANTNYTRDLLVNSNANPEIINIWHEGLDTNYFKRASQRQKVNNKTKILFVGRLVWYKGPDILLKIASILKCKELDFELQIIGSGPEYNKMKELIGSLELTDNVILAGKKSQYEILQAFEESDIFLYPGRTDSNGRQENQGLVIQEAQAMQVPAICSKIGGMPDGVIHEQTGYLVEENDIDDFVNKVILLADNHQLCQKFGHAGRAHTVQNFDIKKIGDKIEETLLSLHSS